LQTEEHASGEDDRARHSSDSVHAGDASGGSPRPRLWIMSSTHDREGCSCKRPGTTGRSVAEDRRLRTTVRVTPAR
jgi:hypothetical protein